MTGGSRGLGRTKQHHAGVRDPPPGSASQTDEKLDRAPPNKPVLRVMGDPPSFRSQAQGVTNP